MTTNSPNPDVQALIEHIKKWKEGSTFFDSVIEFNKRQSQIYEIALASLTAEPYAYLYGASFERGEVEGEIEDSPGTDIPVYTTPPAQLLRPVELPDIRRFCSSHINCNRANELLSEALRQQGYEVK